MMAGSKSMSILKTANVLAVLFSLVARTGAAAVTLYYVDPPAPTTTETDPLSYERFGTTIYSAIGPAKESGVTKYQAQEVMSKVIYHGGKQHGTLTILSVPTTLTYTFEQGASVHHETYPGAQVVTILDADTPIVFTGLNSECKFDTDKKQGVCVDERVIPLPSPVNTVSGETIYTTLTGTRTTTYTGTLLPLATVGTTGGASGLSVSRGVTVGGAMVAMVGTLSLLL